MSTSRSTLRIALVVNRTGAVAFVDGILELDRKAPRKQRHTAHRIWTRLCAEDPAHSICEASVRRYVAERKRDLKAGMVVITGSLIPTFSIAVGDRCVFTVDGLGEAVMDVT